MSLFFILSVFLCFGIGVLAAAIVARVRANRESERRQKERAAKGAHETSNTAEATVK